VLDILTDLSSSVVMPACRENLSRYFYSLRYWSKANFSETSKTWRWQTPLPHPWFNGVLSLRLPGPDASMTIHDMLAYFRSSGVQVFTWWLASEAEAWGTNLEAQGFKFANDPPAMVVELAQLNENILIPDGLRIDRVETAGELQAWTHAFALGYGLPLEWEPDMLEMMIATSKDEGLSFYLAYMKETPVAVSAMLLGAGVAGIYNVGTLPAWRGKGIGAAVTLHPLLVARENGFKVGTLQSSEMGYKVYERLGFKEMFKASHYYFDGLETGTRRT
jgi:ribosomal protein S18 acetylase RimI-like enzyme